MNTQQAELTVHEQLKWICDKIGYKINDDHCWFNGKTYERTYGDATCDEREIIFTDVFINKFVDYISKTDLVINPMDAYGYRDGILNHLDNPCLYLYNLIK